MGWWPFSSSSPPNAVPPKDVSNDNITNSVKPTQMQENGPNVAPSHTTDSGSSVKKELSLEQRNPYRNLESHRDSGMLQNWQSYQETLKPKLWPNGISE
jgi:hypothetical protein